MSQGHRNQASLHQQTGHGGHCRFSFRRTQVHPHGGEQDQIKPLLQAPDDVQLRQLIVYPVDRNGGMNSLPLAAQFVGRLCRGDVMAEPRQRRSVASRAGADIENIARRLREQVKYAAVNALERDALVLRSERGGISVVTSVARRFHA